MDMTCLDKIISGYDFGSMADKEALLLLDGCLNMYNKTGKEEYSRIIKEKFDTYVSVDGVLNAADKEALYVFYAGRCLIFLDKENVNEKYGKAVAWLYEKLTSLERKDGMFVKSGCSSCGSAKADALETITAVMPFYMGYETSYNKKGNYNDIIAQYKVLYDECFDENTEKYSECINTQASFLNSLADVTEAVSEEIYEHFNYLKCLLREAVKGIIPYAGKNNVYTGSDDTEKPAATMLILAAAKKGCASGALLSEKYEEFIAKTGSVVTEGIGRYENDIETVAAFMQCA